MPEQRLLAQLRFLAIAEGISYLLIGLTMILKYRYSILWPNLIVGMAHGVLFIAYCIWVVLVARAYAWKFSRTFLALLASLIPVATFVVEARWLRKTPEA
jgi:integral membrane protein